jgi:ABC-type transport system involved in cytochrome c biogenesis permease subunit
MVKQMKWGKWVVAILALVGFAVALTNVFIDNMPKGEVQKVADYEPWEKETVELLESLPVHDGGRVKPFSTYAGFEMLSVHGARSMKVEGKDGKVHKLKPTEWLMDTLFRPHLAVNLPTFRVDNSEVLEAIGVKPKGRRDRYSYEEIADGRDKLMDIARSYEGIEEDDRDPVQQQTIDLARSMMSYEAVLLYFNFARSGITIRGAAEGEEDKRFSFSYLMSIAPDVFNQIREGKQPEDVDDERAKYMYDQIYRGSMYSKFKLFILPPEDTNEKAWKPVGEALLLGASSEQTDVGDILALEESIYALSQNEKDFRSELGEFKDRVDKRASARGESKWLSMEVSYFKRDYFLNAMVFFLIGSICALGMWGFGQGKVAKILYWGTFGFTILATILCTVAIVIRCIIMQRPPVGNLYDTIIFIATTGVMFSLLVEWMSRKGFALGLAPILGTALIVLARRYEVGDASDHLDPLVAVLDSNFWLTTHVITITLGYSAGLLAAMLSGIYVLIRGLNLDGVNKDLRRSLTKAVYGCICLTVFLSLVGTVLGGVWANYSWGRFWGWDPKENGALMIVLWTLAILHARLGGIIKEWGLHLSSLFTACIVAFSWWHVNFLGVGLHNYGFTTGEETIWTFYKVMCGFIMFGVLMMLIEKYKPDVKTEKAVGDAKLLES